MSSTCLKCTKRINLEQAIKELHNLCLESDQWWMMKEARLILEKYNVNSRKTRTMSKMQEGRS